MTQTTVLSAAPTRRTVLSLCALAVGATPLLLARRARAAEDGPIKLGVLPALTGISADNGGTGSVVAAQMAVDEFNGKIGNRPILLLSADNQNKPDVGVAIARRWIDVDRVHALFDISNSALGLGVQTLSQAAKVPALFSSALTTKLTGESCSPYGVQWSFNSYALANMVARAAVREGAKSWFFITADAEYGASLERDATQAILAEGGKVLGSVKVPFGVADASSFLLQASASKAQVIGIATPGLDTITVIKQSNEFGIQQGGQQLAGLGLSLTEVHAAGLEATQGILVGEAFYWNFDDRTRAFGNAFFKRRGVMPTEYHASVYSSVRQYLTVVSKLGTTDPDQVMKALHETPVQDAFTANGRIRADGQLIHDMYLMRVKKPGTSTHDWDVYDMVRTVPGEEAFQPQSPACPLK